MRAYQWILLFYLFFQTEAILAQDQKDILQLQRELSKNPNDAKAWIKLGDQYYERQDYRTAIKAYRKVEKLKSSEIWSMFL